MILQIKASTLATLLANEGWNGPHAQSVKDAILLARAEVLTPATPDNISNDRTTLHHFKPSHPEF